ncbi:MAG: lysophospholipid acyltransferase family protein [Chloroflexota bacterium]
MSWVQGVSNLALRGTLALFAEYRAYDRARIPSDGPLLVVANHQSNMDPPIVALTLRRGTRFLAKDGIFKEVGPLGSWFLTSYGAHPLRRGRMDLSAFRWAERVLQEPRATLALFPEGTRNPGSMGRAHPGAASLAMRTGVTVLPLGITGTEGMRSWARIFKPKGEIIVRVGEPFRVRTSVASHPAEDVGAARNTPERISIDMMGRIAALLPSTYRGHYADAAEGPFLYTESLAALGEGGVTAGADVTPR